MRDRLLSGLLEAIPDLRINGSMTARLPHNLHVSVPGLGRWTTTATIDHAVERVGRTVRELRSAEVELGRQHTGHTRAPD